MNNTKDVLNLSLLLLFKGILPSQRPDMISSYPEIKSALKENKIILLVDQIEQIAYIILSYSIELMTVRKNKNSDPKDCSENIFSKEELITTINNDLDHIISKIEAHLKFKLTREQYEFTVKTIVNHMSQFNEYKFNNSIKLYSDAYNHILINYISIKSQLDDLFERNLTEQEFQLIAESWCYYASLAQKVDSPDFKLKEIVKEIQTHLKMLINALESSIKQQGLIRHQLNHIKNFIYLDMNTEEKNIDDLKAQLIHYKNLKEKLTFRKGSELYSHHLKDQACFSALFCAESLGLSAPSLNRDGNPLLKFLMIIQGLNFSNIPKSDLKNRMSKLYHKYTKFKHNIPELQTKLTACLKEIEHNDNFEMIKNANKCLQSNLANYKPS